MSEPATSPLFEVRLPEESPPNYPRGGRRLVEVRPSETPALEVVLPDPAPPSKAERERAAFFRLLPELLTTHRGQYVAIHDGQVVDSDADDIALVRRVHARVGYVPLHVGLVTDAPPVGRMPRYREVWPQR